MGENFNRGGSFLRVDDRLHIYIGFDYSNIRCGLVDTS